jgi:hypothetical protein
VRGNQAFVGSTGGRPPAEYRENCDFRDKKAGEFAANTVPLDDLDDWAAAEARACFSPQAAAAAGGGAGGGAGAVEGMEEGAAAEEEGLRKVKLWSNFARRRVIQYLCHSWLMNGEHAGWSGVSDLRNKVKLHFDLATLPAHQAASDWLAKERTAFKRHSAGKEVSHMPLLRKPEGGIGALLAALQEDNVLEDELLKEFKEQEANNAVFTNAMREEFTKEVLSYKGLTGFGTRFVVDLAVDFYERVMGDDVDP